MPEIGKTLPLLPSQSVVTFGLRDDTPFGVFNGSQQRVTKSQVCASCLIVENAPLYLVRDPNLTLLIICNQRFLMEGGDRLTNRIRRK